MLRQLHDCAPMCTTMLAPSPCPSALAQEMGTWPLQEPCGACHLMILTGVYPSPFSVWILKTLRKLHTQGY
jgi:hypothetical protein